MLTDVVRRGSGSVRSAGFHTAHVPREAYLAVTKEGAQRLALGLTIRPLVPLPWFEHERAGLGSAIKSAAHRMAQRCSIS
jgi:hypothetical protein